MLMTGPTLCTTISFSAVRKTRLRVAAVAVGCDPGQLEIRAEPHQLLPLWLAQWWRLGRNHGSEFGFYSAHSLQYIVPAALQLGGH